MHTVLDGCGWRKRFILEQRCAPHYLVWYSVPFVNDRGLIEYRDRLTSPRCPLPWHPPLLIPDHLSPWGEG
jgi:hypothetical protein